MTFNSANNKKTENPGKGKFVMCEKRASKEFYDASTRETYWQEYWKRLGVNKFDPLSLKKLFTIDTPPPTVSGSLHLGHVYSYTQAEVIARYRRLSGFNVRYPMGMDNNGLPTEKLVEKERGVRGKNMSIADFKAICHEVIRTYTAKYLSLWEALGLSVDWSLEYSTISSEVMRIAQTVFKELFDKGLIYKKRAVALYCCHCETSVAQAEVEDKEEESVFYDVVFRDDCGRELIVATTKPELLPACAAVFVHPDDDRYTWALNRNVRTPLGITVKVMTDDKVVIAKGTGAVMCCTYGDETDVYWVRKYGLKETFVLGRDGKFIHLAEIPEIESKPIKEARRMIVAKLKDAGAIKGEKVITHNVGVHERCGTPIELLSVEQWFLKLLDMKDKLIEAGNEIKWHPLYMKKRYQDWIESLKWDWCISRDRFFGTPIPVYTCNCCSRIIIPETDVFPINPSAYSLDISCPGCGQSSFTPEKGVLDTWFTSALTPDINSSSPANGDLAGKMHPMSLRPQAHDIIRTWAVYSVLMSLYRRQEIPWKEIMISGHIMLRKGEKISKKTGGGDKLKPEEIVKKHSADAIRYVMCGAMLGNDSCFDEQEVMKGRKLVTKLYNAGKFVLMNLNGFCPEELVDESLLEPIDRWIVYRSYKVASEMAIEFDCYESGKARQIFEDFFWKDLCDNYFEIVKGRLRVEGGGRTSAQYALCQTFLNILVMISPIIPHITEELYHAECGLDGVIVSGENKGVLRKRSGLTSVHHESWPASGEVLSPLRLEETNGIEIMLSVIVETRRFRSLNQMSLKSPLSTLVIKGDERRISLLNPFKNDLTSVTNSEKIILGGKTELTSEGVLIINI